MTQAAAVRGIPVEVIDVRPAPVERLDAVTARLGTSGGETADNGFVPTLLILCGFDVFGDDTHDAPTYLFRSEFQFDEKFLFGSHRRPLYQAAGDIIPEDWQPGNRHDP